MQLPRPRTHARKRFARTLVMLAILALAFQALAPLGNQIAAAQADPTESAEPTAEVTDATEVPAEVATEIPPTEEPTPEPDHLTITVFRCDHPDFDTGFSENLQRVINECTGSGSADFTINAANGTFQGSGSSLSFDIVGNLDLQGAIPSGYDNPIANCFVSTPDGGQDQIGPGEASGGYWKVGGISGDVHCDWYQVDRGIGNVHVTNLACPSTAGLFPAPSLADLTTACTEPAGAKQFFVTHSGGLDRMGVSGGAGNDALFEAIPTGPIEIRMEDHAAFDKARVFCQVTTLDGAELAPFAEVSVATFRATGLTLVHSQQIDCRWFNILLGPGLAQDNGDTGAVPTATSAANAPSDLIIKKYTCPNNYNPDKPNADPLTDCTPGPDGITFTLADTDPNTVDLQTSTGDSIANAVQFGGLPPGDYTITETLPTGIDHAFVLGCGGGGIGPIPTLVTGSLSIGLPHGVIYTCPWFNVPVPGGGQSAREIGTPIASPTELSPAEASPAVIAALTGTASLTIAKYNCPAGFDVASIDTDPAAQCTPTDGITFNIDDQIDDNAGWYIETGFPNPGLGTVDGLPAGTYFIEEGVLNGTTSTFVWDCYDATGASTRTDPLALGSTLSLEIADGAQIRCDWFNVTGGTARVVVSKHACDYPVPAYTLTREQLAAQCTIDSGTINFTVVSDTHQETQPASNNPLTLASFANIPSGYVAVVEDLPDGWAVPIVFCQVFLEDGTPVGQATQNEVYVGRQINVDLAPGQVASCDWYNVARGFGEAHVAKYACPTGFDAYSADQATLATTCTADPGAVKFSLEDGGLYLQERTASAGVPAEWDSVPSGIFRINETLPDGYGMPVIWCGVDFEDGSTVTAPAPVTLAGSTWITHGVSAGQILRCDWYNVPGGQGAVSIWKQACPQALNAPALTRLELEILCTDAYDPITFTLTSGSFTDTATSTTLFHYADFPAVPTGSVTITETTIGPWDTALVYCHVQEPGKPVTPDQLVDVGAGHAFSWDLAPNQWLICQWYNAYDPGSTVEVHKFACPEGTTYDHEDAWYTTNCTTPDNGVEFTLTHATGTSTMTTASGMVTWSGVPLGPIAIQEHLPLTYGEPVVFCGIVSASGGPIDAIAKRVEVKSGYYATTIAYPRTHYLCYWYNIPGGPSDVTITKYTCPPGYDLTASGANPATDCPTGTNGITYTADGPASYHSQSATGDSTPFAVTFDGLAPGSYTITETVPSGTAASFVLDCTGQVMGELRPTPLSTGDTLHIDVSAGESIHCRWYNVPPDPHGRLTVIKYICSTETYVSDVDCQVEERGVTFDLVVWNGDAWEHADTGTTDTGGTVSWGGIAPGQFWLDEHDAEWCRLDSAQISDDGNWLNVYDGQETVVHVYNCGADPGKPGKTPTKYPNTGVPMRDDWRREP